MKDTKDQGLKYIPLYMDSAKLVLVSDASFANASGLKSQLGYLILRVDKYKNCNILHYAYNRCKRVCRSVMAAEVHAMVLGFDYVYIIRDLIYEITGRKLDIEAITDSKSLFNVVTKDGQAAERRLQIDMLTLKQNYDAGELSRMSWIPGTLNPSDALTKYIVSKLTPLYQVMIDNKFVVPQKGWVKSHEIGVT